MSRVRRLLLGSAGALAGYASGKLLLGRRDRGVGFVLGSGDDDLLGSARGRPRIVWGPRSSRIYTEVLDAVGGDGPGSGGAILPTHG